MNAPPRSMVAPAACAIRAAASVCSGVSTAHGPAISVTVPGPIGTPRACTTERSGWCSRLTSLYSVDTRVTCATPGIPARSSDANASTSPTRPMITRLHAPAHERLAARGLDARHDGLHVACCHTRLHDDDHGTSFLMRRDPAAAGWRRAGTRGGPRSGAGRSATWASSRTTLGSAPGTATSVAHSSGTSTSPRSRAAAAGKQLVRSGVRVNTMLIRSAGPIPLRSTTSVISSRVAARMSAGSSRSTWIAPRTARTTAQALNWPGRLPSPAGPR